MKFVHIIPTLSSVRFCCVTKYNFVSAKPPQAVGLMQLKRKTCAEVEPESDTDDEWFPHLCQPNKVKTATISGASTSNFFSMFLFTFQCWWVLDSFWYAMLLFVYCNAEGLYKFSNYQSWWRFLLSWSCLLISFLSCLFKLIFHITTLYDYFSTNSCRRNNGRVMTPG